MNETDDFGRGKMAIGLVQCAVRRCHVKNKSVDTISRYSVLSDTNPV